MPARFKQSSASCSEGRIIYNKSFQGFPVSCLYYTLYPIAKWAHWAKRRPVGIGNVLASAVDIFWVGELSNVLPRYFRSVPSITPVVSELTCAAQMLSRVNDLDTMGFWVLLRHHTTGWRWGTGDLAYCKHCLCGIRPTLVPSGCS